MSATALTLVLYVCSASACRTLVSTTHPGVSPEACPHVASELLKTLPKAKWRVRGYSCSVTRSMDA